MRIVTNGKQYAIERRSFIFFKEYLDLKYDSDYMWWLRGSRHFCDCVTDDLTAIKERYKKITSKWAPIATRATESEGGRDE